MKALVHVQHLLGIGHAVRAAAIGRALCERGVDVTLVTGNHLPDIVDKGRMAVVALPAARAADVTFSVVVNDKGEAIDQAWMDARKARLLSVFDRVDPDILVTEFFPLGRRKFRFEMIPLLDMAVGRNPKPVVASAVRDILVAKDDPKIERWMADTALKYYDRLLVHGERDTIDLGATFRYATDLEGLISYTGYIHAGSQAPEPPLGDGENEIIVACGGGAVGETLLRAAIESARHDRHHRWRILAGGDLPQTVVEALASDTASDNRSVVIEPARPDFPGLLKRARLIVAQAGYNTVTDILAAGVSAVLVPFAGGRESEQTVRAEALAARGRVVTTPEVDLTSSRLTEAVKRALELPERWPVTEMDGAARSAEILIELAKKREGK